MLVALAVALGLVVFVLFMGGTTGVDVLVELGLVALPADELPVALVGGTVPLAGFVALVPLVPLVPLVAGFVPF